MEQQGFFEILMIPDSSKKLGVCNNMEYTVRFIYSEKATKLCEISTNYLSHVLQFK